MYVYVYGDGDGHDHGHDDEREVSRFQPNRAQFPQEAYRNVPSSET